ncbi:HTH-type transcriptional regulator Ptr1 [uncultured archaeon]|nr:HTH-type transcriptional regulator Ptr1 [uncultured archaeon]
MPVLDLLDRRIMYELDLNARVPAAKLAKTLRKSKETVNFRIKRLLSEGYLKGFYTVFNTSALGWYYHKMYVKFRSITPEKEREIINYLKERERIAYLANREGFYNCTFLVMSRSPRDMSDFLDAFMKKYGECIEEKQMVIFLSTHRLNHRFLYNGKAHADYFYPIEMGNYELDETDKRILQILSTNARSGASEIAKRIRADPKTVAYRIRKLEKDRIILGYVSSPNFEKLGLEFIQINISLKDPARRRDIIRYFDSTDKCVFGIELLGRYDLTIEVHVQGRGELKKIMDGFRAKFVDQYNDYDISTISEEHVVVWCPFPKGESLKT